MDTEAMKEIVMEDMSTMTCMATDMEANKLDTVRGKTTRDKVNFKSMTRNQFKFGQRLFRNNEIFQFDRDK